MTTSLVSSFQRQCDPAGDLQRLINLDVTGGFDPLGETVALDQLHGDEAHTIRFLEAEDGGDVRVVQRGEQLGFTLEPSQTSGVGGEVLRQHLDRDFAIKRRVACAVDLAHAACTERGDDLVVAERLADHQEPPVGTSRFNSSNQLRTTLSRVLGAVPPVSSLPAGTVTRNFWPSAVTSKWDKPRMTMSETSTGSDAENDSKSTSATRMPGLMGEL